MTDNDDLLARYGYSSPGQPVRPATTQADGTRWPGIDHNGLGWAMLRVVPADLTDNPHAVQILKLYPYQVTYTQRDEDVRIL